MLDYSVFITTYGPLGIILAMILQTSILPIPWEFIIVTAIALHMPMPLVIGYSCIGALIGGCACYTLGRFAGLVMILRYGKYLGIRHTQIVAMEHFSKKYGKCSVALGQALPFIPYKIFSLTAGLIDIRFIPFLSFTLLGLLPRLWLIAFMARLMTKA